MISIVVAIDQNNLIGKDNGLPWGHLPVDLKHFKNITDGKTIVMGRKTFQSLPNILQNRKHVVLSRGTIQIRDPFVCQYNSIENVLELAKNEDLFIIGGAEIYKQFAPYADKIYLTEVQGEFIGDTYLPDLGFKDFRLESISFSEIDEKNKYECQFEEWVRE